VQGAETKKPAAKTADDTKASTAGKKKGKKPKAAVKANGRMGKNKFKKLMNMLKKTGGE